jgi:hypothetical protein
LTGIEGFIFKKSVRANLCPAGQKESFLFPGDACVEGLTKKEKIFRVVWTSAREKI